MEPSGTVGARATRGRIVMLVDNGVEGDSRVQKTARSAADQGWDVTLLGLVPSGGPRIWTLGAATVRLLPMPLRRSGLPARIRTRLGGRPPSSGDAPGVPGGPEIPGNGPTPAQRPSVRSRLLGATRGLYRGVRDPWDRARVAFWTATMGDRAWRRLAPGLWDYERGFGPVIDELAPDLIHANDFRMLGVGARATQRARAAGRTIKLVWDAHEYLPGLTPRIKNALWLPAHCAYEREYAPFADAVVTVSTALADLLQKEHALAERPEVVLNAPNGSLLHDGGAGDVEAGDKVPDVRTQCGVGAGTPLLAYIGGIAPVRGVEVMIDSLPALPEVHVALVSLPPGRSSTRYVDEVLARADRLGVAQRVHVLSYVPYQQVASFLAAADGAVSPLLHDLNHEIALSNKFFEYSHARLPIIVSDVRTMAETVRSTGQGEVFRAGDVADYTRAVNAVLADPERYRAAYDKPGLLEGWTWEAQAQVLDQVYRRVLGVPS